MQNNPWKPSSSFLYWKQGRRRRLTAAAGSSPQVGHAASDHHSTRHPKAPAATTAAPAGPSSMCHAAARASSLDYPLEHEHRRRIVPPTSAKPIYPSAHSSSPSPSYKYAQSTLTPISIAALPPLKLSSELTAGTRPPPHPYPNRATH